jgi:tagaturonate epimerase
MGLTENTATTLLGLNSLDVRPNSAVCVEGTEAGLVGSSQRVAILALSGSQVPSNFEGESSVAGGRTLVIGPMNAANLDALRTVAALHPDLFREIYDFSRGCYEEDRATYHVSASLERAVQPRDMPDGELPALLERFDEREILHVTFGSVLKEARFRDRLLGLVRDHPDHYAAGLEEHFLRHLEPFANGGCK